jgi:hypothetical protein
MDSPVIAAFVAGCFGIVSPIVTFVVTKQYEKRFLQPISRDRAHALVGKWQGKIIQENLTCEIELNIEAVRRKVVGKATIIRIVEEKKKLVNLDLDGGFLHDRFLKIDYKNSDSGTIQFGSMTLELEADPKSMTGRYSGYGSFSKCIIFGVIEVAKVAVV